MFPSFRLKAKQLSLRMTTAAVPILITFLAPLQDILKKCALYSLFLIGLEDVQKTCFHKKMLKEDPGSIRCQHLPASPDTPRA